MLDYGRPKKSLLVVFLILILCVLFIQHEKVAAATTMDRIWGQNRYETAVEISKSGWDTALAVVLATGENYPDALAGVPFAYSLDAPILLTQSNQLPIVTENEMKRLKTRKVYILGGPVAISGKVENQLANLGIEVIRIGGENRYHTAALLAEQMGTIGIDKAVLVDGSDFIDALVISPYAAREGIPILLTRKDSIPSETKTALKNMRVEKTIIIGGFNKISAEIEAQLPSPIRIYNNNHYSNGIEIATYFNNEQDKYFIATGNSFADAISGGVLAAKKNAGILLVGDTVPLEVEEYLKNKGGYSTAIFGGPSAISEEIQRMFESGFKHKPNEKERLEIPDIYDQVIPAVVSIETYDHQGTLIGSGTGFVIKSNGEIITNYHVIQGASHATARFIDGKAFDIERVLNYDSVKDLAYLKIEGSGFPIVRLGNSKDIRTGDRAIAIGNPLGYDNTVSDGLISNRSRIIEGQEYIQVSTPVSPGNSGGPVLNDQGEVIGIITWGSVSGQNLNFAIPIDTAKEYFNNEKERHLSDLGKGETEHLSPTGLWREVVSDSEVIIGWNKSPGADYYKIYLATDYDGPYYDLYNDYDEENYFQWFEEGIRIYGLESNTMYYFMVSSVKDDIESEYGSVIEAMTLYKNYNLPMKELYLEAHNGEYLGRLTTNIYHADSIFNEFGSYGSKYGFNSIWNDFSNYGGKYSQYSPFNDFTNTPPYIITSDGIVVGRLTTNWTVSGAISPYKIYGILLELGL